MSRRHGFVTGDVARKSLSHNLLGHFGRLFGGNVACDGIFDSAWNPRSHSAYRERLGQRSAAAPG
jgi:hypothetical protein